MNRSMLAGIALLAGAAIAAPIAAGSAADNPPQTPPGPGAGPAGPGPAGPMGWSPEHMGPGMMGRHHWMHGMMMQRSPQQRCEERLARRAGIIAYTVAKLNLTAEQRPLWDKLNGILQSSSDRERQLCASLKPPEQRAQETILDRTKRREQFLTARLQTLQQARPALEALYQALTPEQKAILDHPMQH
jgi:hypothetical protein